MADNPLRSVLLHIGVVLLFQDKVPVPVVICDEGKVVYAMCILSFSINEQWM